MSSSLEGVFLWTVSLVWNVLWDEQIISPLCATGTLHITVSMLYFHRFFACHLSKSCTRLSWLSQSQAQWPLKLQMLSPAGFKNLKNLAPFVFQANCFGNWFFLYAPLCASFSSCPSWWLCSLLLPPHHSFSSKMCLYTSCFLWCGLFSVFCCRVCSPSVQVNFWGIYDFDSYLVVFGERDDFRVLLLYHHLPTFSYIGIYIYRNWFVLLYIFHVSNHFQRME